MSDQNQQLTATDEQYLSISAAAKQYNIPTSAIRAAMKNGKVRSQDHKWGTRVHSGDVEALKASRTQPNNS